MRWKSILVSVMITAAIVFWMSGGNIGNEAVREAAAKKEDASVIRTGEAPKAFLVKVMKSVAVPFASQININGRTKAVRASVIKAEITASVNALSLQDGDRVSQGDLLVKLDQGTRPSAYRSAIAALESAKKNFEAIASLNTSGFQSELELLRAREAMTRAQEDVERSRIALDDTKITAPFDGIIKDVAIELDDYINAGAVIGHILDLNPIEVISFISEREYGSVRLGQRVKVRLIDGQEYDGEVSYISASSDTRTGTFEVRVEIANPEMRIPEGISADVTIFTAKTLAHFQSKSVLSLSEKGEVGVKAVNDAGRAVFHPATIIDDTEEGVYLSGLPEELLLIVSGQAFVKDGSPVRIEGDVATN